MQSENDGIELADLISNTRPPSAEAPKEEIEYAASIDVSDIEEAIALAPTKIISEHIPKKPIIYIHADFKKVADFMHHAVDKKDYNAFVPLNMRRFVAIELEHSWDLPKLKNMLADLWLELKNLTCISYPNRKRILVDGLYPTPFSCNNVTLCAIGIPDIEIKTIPFYKAETAIKKARGESLLRFLKKENEAHYDKEIDILDSMFDTLKILLPIDKKISDKSTGTDKKEAFDALRKDLIKNPGSQVCTRVTLWKTEHWATASKQRNSLKDRSSPTKSVEIVDKLVNDHGNKIIRTGYTRRS